ncbi:MAG: hypothetical protein KDJ52_02390 [Anaerolineae bacterium]|nr:hypothetical protein [Anaerolineae bacterium]
MTEANNGPPNWLDNETLGAVRPAVRDVLMASPAFSKLTPEEQRELAQTMVKVSAYMANPDGVVTETEPETKEPPPLASAQANATEQLRSRLAQDPGFAGQDFEGGAIRQGTDQFRRLVQAVDFPQFVGGLIRNVFEAIVDTSIEQMRAYGELLANVAKSVDDFARDNISENNARDWLSQRFPDQLGVGVDAFGGGFAEGDETAAPQPRLEATGDDPDSDLNAISGELGVNPSVTDLSDENEELRLVLAARLAIARSRQQLLASMVMLGINRIVVTDGHINAKVVFDMRARDVAARHARASMYDREAQRTKAGMRASYSSWFSPVSASAYAETQTEHVATVSSAVDDTSESRAEVKARLSGDVRVNFKSDFLPMDRMATPEMIAAIQGNAQPQQRPVEGA